ncbi:MAG: deoxyribose-phosphate aldolase [bacterium]
MTYDSTLARIIDHTLLKPDATLRQIDQLCQEALDFQFASVCINPCYIKQSATRLKDSQVKVCTVIGFPLGATLTEQKSFETTLAIARGAEEIDMVMNIGMLKSGEFQYVKNDIRSVVQVAKSSGALVKVILETALLDEEEKARACSLALEAGADFVKTSTGFAKSGATTADVRLMRSIVGDTMGVKASGGIKTYQDAVAMVQSGANRLGTSSGIVIVTGGTMAQSPAY